MFNSTRQKPNSWRSSGLVWLPAVFLMVALDQISKLSFDFYLELGETKPWLSFFQWTLVYNKGAAFGLLADQPGWQRLFLSAVSLLASLFVVYWLRVTPRSSKLEAVALMLLLSGAIGNLIDRVMLGYVIDFIDFFYQDWHWPAFNVADINIVVGVALLLWHSLLVEREKSKKNPQTEKTSV